MELKPKEKWRKQELKRIPFSKMTKEECAELKELLKKEQKLEEEWK